MFTFFKHSLKESLDDLHHFTCSTEPVTVTTGSTPSVNTTDNVDIINPTDATSSGQQDTTFLSFFIKSKLGWIAWKETESTLFRIFEMCFHSTHLELKVTESLEEFCMCLEMPTEHVLRFKKVFAGSLLCAEIDKIHGISPLSSRKKDAVLYGLSISCGSSPVSKGIESSLLSAEARLQALEECHLYRKRELAAIHEQYSCLREDTQSKVYKTETSFHESVYEHCTRRFESMEKNILATVESDLTLLKS